MLTLNHGDFVYLETWQGLYDDCAAKVGTVRGFLLESEKGPNAADEAEDRAIKLGHPLAWTLHTGFCLYGDKKESERAALRRKEVRAKAFPLQPGQVVRIEGRTYSVRVPYGNTNGPRNSDPIIFLPKQENSHDNP